MQIIVKTQAQVNRSQIHFLDKSAKNGPIFKIQVSNGI